MEKYYMEMSEVKNFIYKLENDAEYDGVKFTADYICDLIDFVPKERVKEYFIGEWKWTPVSGMLYCSCCDNFNPAKIEFNYCPNCGAEMKRRVE